MKAKVLAFSPLGMVGRGKVGQKAEELHVLPGRVGRQSEFAPNSLPGCPLLTPRAQGKELAVHKLSSLKVEAKDNAGGGTVARHTILQEPGPRDPARLEQYANIIGALLRKHGFTTKHKRIKHTFQRKMLPVFGWLARQLATDGLKPGKEL